MDEVGQTHMADGELKAAVCRPGRRSLPLAETSGSGRRGRLELFAAGDAPRPFN